MNVIRFQVNSWQIECPKHAVQFKILLMYFHYFVIISHWKRAGPFIWTNLSLLHTRMHCAKFGQNLPSGYGEENFSNFVNVFLLFCNYLPLERAGPFICPNLSPLHPRMLCAKFGWNWSRGSWEEDFFKFVNVFSLFRKYLPLEKGGTLHMNLGMACDKKLVQWFWRRKWKCGKFSTTTTTTTITKTDNGPI